MTLQQVNVGAIPNDGTGDDPRTGAQKWNANFSDTTNMAALLAQASPTDVTAGRGVTTDALDSNSGPILTDENVNLRNFGATAEFQIVATGVAVSASLIRFYLNVDFITPPQSITVTSTFSLARISGDTTVDTGLNSGDIVLSSALTGNKVVMIQYNSASGLIAGETYELRAETGTSEIQVNP